MPQPFRIDVAGFNGSGWRPSAWLEPQETLAAAKATLAAWLSDPMRRAGKLRYRIVDVRTGQAWHRKR